MVFHKAGLEAGVSPKDELKCGARDLTGPGPTEAESTSEETSSHLDFLFGVVIGVREEKVEEVVRPGVEDTNLLVPELSVTLALSEAGGGCCVVTGEGDGREDETIWSPLI